MLVSCWLLCRDTWDDQLEGEKVHLGSRLEASVPGHLASLFLGCSEAEHRGGQPVIEEAAPLMVSRKQRQGKELGATYALQGHTPGLLPLLALPLQFLALPSRTFGPDG